MTIRKQILQAMQAAIMPAASLNGRVFRSRAAALAREETPALVIRPADESTNGMGEVAERDFSVQILIFTRGEIPDDIADDVIAEVHALLCVDPSFGGFAAHLFEAGSTWTFADTDETACELDVRYRVRLYTPEDSLSNILQ
jgi:hypothetical protein